MGHTNETNNLRLPQFVATDKPTFLGDINGAMLAIDNAYGTISAEATGAASTAQTAATAAASAVETASGAVATAQQAATDATAAAGVANTAAATANNAQSTAVLAKETADDVSAAVGDLADLGTTDKTSVVAAINEVIGELPSGGSVSVTADGVKTIAALLNELFALIDSTKISVRSAFKIGGQIYHISTIADAAYRFGVTTVSSANVAMYALSMSASSASYAAVISTAGVSSYTDESSSVPNNGTVLEVIY